MLSMIHSTYSSSELSGPDTEADSNVEADSRSLVFAAQRHLLVNLLRQSKRRPHLNNRTGPTAQRTHSEGF